MYLRNNCWQFIYLEDQNFNKNIGFLSIILNNMIKDMIYRLCMSANNIDQTNGLVVERPVIWSQNSHAAFLSVMNVHIT